MTVAGKRTDADALPAHPHWLDTEYVWEFDHIHILGFHWGRVVGHGEVVGCPL